MERYTVCISLNSIRLSRQFYMSLWDFIFLSIFKFSLSLDSFVVSGYWYLFVQYTHVQYSIQTWLTQPSSSVNSKFSSHFNESNYSLFKFCWLIFFLLLWFMWWNEITLVVHWCMPLSSSSKTRNQIFTIFILRIQWPEAI